VYYKKTSASSNKTKVRKISGPLFIIYSPLCMNRNAPNQVGLEPNQPRLIGIWCFHVDCHRYEWTEQ
jgi:hypothetical protein